MQEAAAEVAAQMAKKAKKKKNKKEAAEVEAEAEEEAPPSLVWRICWTDHELFKFIVSGCNTSIFKQLIFQS